MDKLQLSVASVSIGKCLKPTWRKKTIATERMICDSVNKELSIEGSKDVSKIKIDKEMLRYCSKASSGYRVYLSEKRQN